MAASYIAWYLSGTTCAPLGTSPTAPWRRPWMKLTLEPSSTGNPPRPPVRASNSLKRWRSFAEAVARDPGVNRRAARDRLHDRGHHSPPVLRINRRCFAGCPEWENTADAVGDEMLDQPRQRRFIDRSRGGERRDHRNDDTAR